ncbi:MAG: hypothetical protein IAF58_02555, partial [Leptolyngbya sp.]|nr:hypothetical protein [Candidatus Melainabacteria bacterium]
VVGKGQPAAAPVVYELRLRGLYRKNDMGQQVVYDFAKALAKSAFFATADIGDNLQAF